MVSWRTFVLLLLFVLSILATACEAPAFDREDYLHKASTTAEEAASALETASLAVESASRHGLPTQPIEIALVESEETVSSIFASFGSVKPPSPEQDALRDDLLNFLDEAEDQLAAARIALQRGDVRSAAEELSASRNLADDLRTLAKSLES